MNKRIFLKFVSIAALLLYLAGFAWLGIKKVEEFGSQSRFFGAVERVSLRVHKDMGLSERRRVLSEVQALLTQVGYEQENYTSPSFNVVETGSFDVAEFDALLSANDVRTAKARLVEVSVRIGEEHNKNQSILQILFIIGLVGCYAMASVVAFFFGKAKVVEHRLDGRAVDLDEILPSSPLGVAVQNVCNVESVKAGHDFLLELKGDDLVDVTDESYPIIESCICELVTNSIVHGGRATAVREAANKPATLKVFVGVEKDDKNWVVTVADDGEGINEVDVMQHAVAKQLLAKESIQSLQEGQGVRLILLDGFSDAKNEKVGPLKQHSLAGVRMALQNLGGSISLRNRPSVFCEFKLVLPINKAAN